MVDSLMQSIDEQSLQVPMSCIEGVIPFYWLSTSLLLHLPCVHYSTIDISPFVSGFEERWPVALRMLTKLACSLALVVENTDDMMAFATEDCPFDEFAVMDNSWFDALFPAQSNATKISTKHFVSKLDKSVCQFVCNQYNGKLKVRFWCRCCVRCIYFSTVWCIIGCFLVVFACIMVREDLQSTTGPKPSDVAYNWW
jgi:hypothetical protein